MNFDPQVTDRRGGRGTDYRVDDSDVDGAGGHGKSRVLLGDGLVWYRYDTVYLN